MRQFMRDHAFQFCLIQFREQADGDGDDRMLGIAAGGNAPQVGVALGTFQPAPEVIALVLPIQTVIALTLPIGRTPPVIVPPWVTA